MYISSKSKKEEAEIMQHLRPHIDRWFMGFVGIFILSQVSLGFRETDISKPAYIEGKGISSFVNPKGYFISKIAPLFKNWGVDKVDSTEKGVNEVFQELGIKARLIENTIRLCNGSFEFLVYIPAYKRDFLFRYTPLVDNLANLIQKEGFLLEVKIFSGWMPVTLDRLFG